MKRIMFLIISVLLFFGCFNDDVEDKQYSYEIKSCYELVLWDDEHRDTQHTWSYNEIQKITQKDSILKELEKLNLKIKQLECDHIKFHYEYRVYDIDALWLWLDQEVGYEKICNYCGKILEFIPEDEFNCQRTPIEESGVSEVEKTGAVE